MNLQVGDNVRDVNGDRWDVEYVRDGNIYLFSSERCWTFPIGDKEQEDQIVEIVRSDYRADVSSK